MAETSGFSVNVGALRAYFTEQVRAFADKFIEGRAKAVENTSVESSEQSPPEKQASVDGEEQGPGGSRTSEGNYKGFDQGNEIEAPISDSSGIGAGQEKGLSVASENPDSSSDTDEIAAPVTQNNSRGGSGQLEDEPAGDGGGTSEPEDEPAGGGGTSEPEEEPAGGGGGTS
ncbi:hypothetical protein RA19_23975, partial [Leisingera sp. ANG-M1]